MKYHRFVQNLVDHLIIFVISLITLTRSLRIIIKVFSFSAPCPSLKQKIYHGKNCKESNCILIGHQLISQEIFSDFKISDLLHQLVCLLQFPDYLTFFSQSYVFGYAWTVVTKRFSSKFCVKHFSLSHSIYYKQLISTILKFISVGQLI